MFLSLHHDVIFVSFPRKAHTSVNLVVLLLFPWLVNFFFKSKIENGYIYDERNIQGGETSIYMLAKLYKQANKSK